MPKFVPVVDTEKPLSEQDHRSKAEFSKHRQFDNPYNINNYSNNNNSSNNNNNSNVKNKKKVVDRGWEQGNVGWGVLGSFGSNSKDDSAQVIKRVEGKYIYIKIFTAIIF